MEHNEREELKAVARAAYDEAETDLERVSAIQMLIEAHYERSREAYGATHPGFAVYAAHWLESQKDRVDKPGGLRLGSGEFAILRRIYPAPKSPRIPPGMSYWHSPAQYKEAVRKAKKA